MSLPRRKPAGGLHRARGGGTRDGATARGWSAGSEPSRVHPQESPASSVPGAGPGQRDKHVPPCYPGVCSRSKCAGAHGGGTFGSRGCSCWDPTFLGTPAAPRRRPQTLRFLKVAKRLEAGGLRSGAGRLGRTAPGPGRALLQRCGAAPLRRGRLQGCSTPYLLSETHVEKGVEKRTRAQVLPQLRKVRIWC